MLARLVAQIRDGRKYLEQQEGDIPFKSRQGWAIQRRQVNDTMPGLLTAVTTAVIPKKVVVLFLKADDPEAAGAAAQVVAENGGVVFDAAKTWVDVEMAVSPGMGPTRTWSVNTHHLAVGVIANAARDLGIEAMDRPGYVDVVDTSHEGILAAARQIAQQSDLRDLVMRRFKAEIVEAVVAEELVTKPVPVLVINAAPEEMVALATCASKSTMKTLTPEEAGLLLAGEGAKILHEAFQTAA